MFNTASDEKPCAEEEFRLQALRGHIIRKSLFQKTLKFWTH